jgi:hypothetical protein
MTRWRNVTSTVITSCSAESRAHDLLPWAPDWSICLLRPARNLVQRPFWCKARGGADRALFERSDAVVTIVAWQPKGCSKDPATYPVSVCNTAIEQAGGQQARQRFIIIITFRRSADSRRDHLPRPSPPYPHFRCIRSPPMGDKLPTHLPHPPPGEDLPCAHAMSCFASP